MKYGNVVYGLSALLIIAGAILQVFLGYAMGYSIIFLGFIIGSIYSVWEIMYLKKENKKLKEANEALKRQNKMS